MYTHVALKIRYNKRQIFTSMFMNIHTCVHVTDSLAYTLCDKIQYTSIARARMLSRSLAFFWSISLLFLYFSIHLFFHTHGHTYLSLQKSRIYVSCEFCLAWSCCLLLKLALTLSLVHALSHTHARTACSCTHLCFIHTLGTFEILKLILKVSGRISVLMSTCSVIGVSYRRSNDGFCAEEGQNMIFDPLPRNKILWGNPYRKFALRNGLHIVWYTSCTYRFLEHFSCLIFSLSGGSVRVTVVHRPAPEINTIHYVIIK